VRVTLAIRRAAARGGGELAGAVVQRQLVVAEGDPGLVLLEGGEAVAIEVLVGFGRVEGVRERTLRRVGRGVALQVECRVVLKAVLDAIAVRVLAARVGAE